MSTGCDEETLDHLTLVIEALAIKFGVSFRHAAQRAVSLELVSQGQWDALQELALSEAVHRSLSNQ